MIKHMNTKQFKQNIYSEIAFKIDDVEYKSNEKQLETQLPSNLFSGQVQQITTSGGVYVKIDTRIKDYEQIKNIVNAKCQQVPKYERIICINFNSITYHKYDGEVIQKLQNIPLGSKLTINKDNLNALIFSFQRVNLIKIILQYCFNLKQLNKTKFFRKSYIIRAGLSLLKILGYSIIQQRQIMLLLQNYRIKQIYFLLVSLITILDHNLSTIHNNLRIINYLILSQRDQLQIQDKPPNLMSNHILIRNVVVLTLSFLKIFDNTIMVSSTYGHLYTFNLDDLTLINLDIITGPSQYIYDVKIQDQYVVVKGLTYLVLYKNTGDWTINNPFLSLEAVPIFSSDCIALYKQNNVVNILNTDYSYYVANSIIDDKIVLKRINLQQTVPSTLFISASNGYSLNVIYFSTIKIDV